MTVRSTDSFMVAYKFTHVMLARGLLPSFSSFLEKPKLYVTTMAKTNVYEVWSNVQNKKVVPELELIRSEVRSNFIDDELSGLKLKNDNTVMEGNLSDANTGQQDINVELNNASELATSCEDLLPVLEKIYGFNDFRPKQKEAIKHILDKKDCFVSLPTGGGKSIIYTVPTIGCSGVTLVIMPTLALIKDQVSALRAKNVKAAIYTGESDSSTKQTILQMIRAGDPTLKSTPEVSQDPLFNSSIYLLSSRGELQMMVFDEAHCVFTWGTSFRTAYQKCNLFRQQMPNVPILLLSASATVTIRKEIERMLGLVETVLVADTFNRPNLAYFVKQKSKESLDEIANKIKNQKCALIYCSKHDDVEYVASFLRSKYVSCRFYHAGLNSQLKEKLHNEWKEGKLVSLACTTAFGMGIDKPMSGLLCITASLILLNFTIKKQEGQAVMECLLNAICPAILPIKTILLKAFTKTLQRAHKIKITENSQIVS